MKRIPAAILPILSALALAACGQGNTPAQGNAPAQGSVSPQGNNAAAPSAPQASSDDSSDQKVLTQVRSTLETLPGVDSGQISVSVSQGIVTLVGPVDSPEQEQKILQRVAQLEGVRSVVDDLQLAKGS